MTTPTETTIQTPAETTAPVRGRRQPDVRSSSFQPIPTRIRDVRRVQAVPPLVVDPGDGDRNGRDQDVNDVLDELGSRLARAHRTAAEGYLSQGNFAGALVHLEARALLEPGSAEQQQQLGLVRYITGDDGGAIHAFHTVLAADDQNGDAWYNLGMVLFGQEQFAEAEACFQKAIECDPSDALTWNNRGVCLFKLGRGADARACFQRALQIDPDAADAQYNFASVD